MIKIQYKFYQTIEKSSVIFDILKLKIKFKIIYHISGYLITEIHFNLLKGSNGCHLQTP